MKTFALIGCIMMAINAFSAKYDTTPETLDCRQYAEKYASYLTATQLVELDLINGLWMQDDSKKYLFNSNGNAQIVNFDNAQHISAVELSWRVEEMNGNPVLILQDNTNNAEKYLLVEQTCAGLQLTNISNQDVVSLQYWPLPNNGSLETLKTKLEGDWTNVSWSSALRQCNNLEDKAGAYLNFRFNADGTYKMSCGNRKSTKHEEVGIWELSKDGAFIFFHAEGQDLKVAKIDRLDDHGLILEQSGEAPGFEAFFCNDLTSFTFIK